MDISFVIIGIIWVGCIYLLLWKAASMDPGIIPKKKAEHIIVQQPEPPQVESIDPDNPTPVITPPPPRPKPPQFIKEIVHNGQVVQMKYCYTCNFYRSPRTTHCSFCNNCVDGFDHHCPWVGNCVGKRNYRFFYAFVVSLTWLIVYGILLSLADFLIVSLNLYFDPKNESRGFWQWCLIALKWGWPDLCLILYLSIMVFSVGGLSAFHTYLICVGETTYEYIKKTYRGSNPFSHGCLRNFWYILCKRDDPSLLEDFNHIESENPPTERDDQRLIEDPSVVTEAIN